MYFCLFSFLISLSSIVRFNFLLNGSVWVQFYPKPFWLKWFSLHFLKWFALVYMSLEFIDGLVSILCEWFGSAQFGFKAKKPNQTGPIANHIHTGKPKSLLDGVIYDKVLPNKI